MNHKMTFLLIAVPIIAISLLSGCIAGRYDFTTAFRERIKDDMPIFVFELSADFDESVNGYSLKTLTITDSLSENVVQEICIPELTLLGHTNIPVSSKETMGFELEDLNFDGYKDVRLLDTDNGQYLVEWIYLVWNPSKHIFEHDTRLNDIPLAVFDQDKQLIYGKYAYSASDHHFSTYKYINGTPTLIHYYSKELLGSKIGLTNIEEYIKHADQTDIKTDSDNFLIYHETVSSLNEKTGKMEMISDEYVFCPDSAL